MNSILAKYDNLYFIVGRFLIGLYFVLPGIMKIFDYSGSLVLMEAKGVPLASLLLPLTVLMQIGLGGLIIFGSYLRLSALLLFGLTILINLFIHDFWALQGDPSYGHELQNFVKNLGIAAGLLILATKQKDE